MSALRTARKHDSNLHDAILGWCVTGINRTADCYWVIWPGEIPLSRLLVSGWLWSISASVNLNRTLSVKPRLCSGAVTVLFGCGCGLACSTWNNNMEKKNAMAHSIDFFFPHPPLLLSAEVNTFRPPKSISAMHKFLDWSYSRLKINLLPHTSSLHGGVGLGMSDWGEKNPSHFFRFWAKPLKIWIHWPSV